MAEKLKLAVVTGGHSYDVVNFHRLFAAIDGVEPFIQHMDDFASSDEATRDSYDVVLFYIMLMQTPAPGAAWYAGDANAALEHLGTRPGQGIFVLHHAILAYPEWPLWTEITGLADRKFDYHPEQAITVHVADAAHPITKGLTDWQMGDETYTMAEPEKSRVLLATEHPKSMKAIAWTREHRASRVFCFQSGHDNVTWADSNFREVLKRGVLWCAKKL